MKSGSSRRLLAHHSSVHHEPGLTLKADGHPMIDPKGKPMALHADGIALSRTRGRGDRKARRRPYALLEGIIQRHLCALALFWPHLAGA